MALPCVHQVLPTVPSAIGPARDLAITPDQLEALFRSAGDAVAQGGGLGVTFDDGYRSVLEHALPLAEHYRVPIAVFLTTGFIDGTHRPVEELIACLVRDGHLGEEDDASREAVYRHHVRAARRRGRGAPAYVARLARRCGVAVPSETAESFLSWAEVRKIARHPLVTLGAHTVTHPNLKYVAPIGAWRELASARWRLERETGVAVNTVAYPYGRSWGWTRWLARRAGYERGYGTDDGDVDARASSAGRSMNVRRATITQASLGA